MKFLLSFLLFLLPLAGFGANPGFQNFYGGGGIIVVTNPVTGFVGISNGLSSVTFGGGVGGSLSSGVLTISNTASRCTVYLAADVSRIIISGAGTAEANGTYVNQSFGSVWTNTSGAHVGIYFNGSGYFITNSANLSYYTASAVNGTWATDLDGTPPDATGTYDNLTNCAPFLTPGIYWVQTNGVDATSMFGDPSRPALTPGHAISNTPAGGAVYILPGNYPVSAYFFPSNGIGAINLINRSNIAIRGTPGLSIINSANNIGTLVFMTNCQGILWEGVTFKGRVLTNYTGFTNNCLGAVGGVSMIDCTKVTYDYCQWIDHHNFGLHELGIFFDRVSFGNTVRNGYFNNCGSAITNCAVTVDGGAIQCGAWLIENCVVEGNLRGVEVYATAATSTNRTAGFAIRGGTFRNNLQNHIAINAYMENGVVESCTFSNAVGYTHRGSNFFVEFRAVWVEGPKQVIRNNTFTGQAQYGVWCNSQFVNMSNIVISGNTFQLITNPGNAAVAIGLLNYVDGTTQLQNPVVENNLISEIMTIPVQLFGTSGAIFRNNYLLNPVSAGGLYAFRSWVNGSAINSNLLIEANSFIDEGTANMTYALEVDAGSKDVRFINNVVKNPLTGIINNGAGVELFVSFPSREVFPAFTSGVYVNGENDTDITLGVGSARTNRLHTPYKGHEVTVRDGTSTAGIGIVLHSASGVVSGGYTNMTTNFASVTLRGNGTNWQVKSTHP